MGETMATREKIGKAFHAMKRLGISEEKVRPVLRRLLKLYGKSWELIEDDNYRTLADAIFECEDDENGERKEERPFKKQNRGNGEDKMLSKEKGKSIVCKEELDLDLGDNGNQVVPREGKPVDHSPNHSLF